VLLRLVNAGLRMHVPSVVGLPMSLIAEDGNKLPGVPKVQSEVFLAAGRRLSHDRAAGAASATNRTMRKAARRRKPWVGGTMASRTWSANTIAPIATMP